MKKNTAATGKQREQSMSYSCAGPVKPRGLQEAVAPRVFRQSAYERGKVISPTHRPPLPPTEHSWYSFLPEMCRPRGHSATVYIKSMKNIKDPIGKLACVLPVCTPVKTTIVKACTRLCLCCSAVTHGNPLVHKLPLTS